MLKRERERRVDDQAARLAREKEIIDKARDEVRIKIKIKIKKKERKKESQEDLIKSIQHDHVCVYLHFFYYSSSLISCHV